MNKTETIKVTEINRARIEAVIAAIGKVIVGKENAIRLALACLIAKGHLLIEDTPGVGKTTLAHTLAKVLGLSYQRIQFTSDLLPADILGVSVYNQAGGRFEFHAGPIFANVILADEINRATPRTQSALLEAMAEQQVTMEGETRDLPTPFFVIATQNPAAQVGAFELPESQLDRFLMRIELGYPDPAAERELLSGNDRKELLGALTAVGNTAGLINLQAEAGAVHVSAALLDYLQAILEFSRHCGHYQQGLSPRAGLGLLSAARAWAVLSDRRHVMPEDIQAVLPGVIGHRLQFAQDTGGRPAEAARHLIRHVPVP